MMQRYLGFIFLIAFLLPLVAFSAITGKIAGVITDAKTGEPLPSVNVVLVGTTLGAATDLQGRYFIIQVPPGVYEVQASIVGYKKIGKSSVRVNIDRTTTVDFALEPEVVAGEEVVVVAERPKIQRDVSFTQQTLSSAEVNSLPITPDLREAIEVGAGVGRNIVGMVTIRESNYDEVGLYVDGFNNNDARQGTPEFTVAKNEIQEVQILKGGFNAEYGKVRAGVVNLITKEGGARYSVNIDTRASPAARKHFGPDMFGPDNYWYVGRFLSLDPTGDRDGDGNPDFVGWRQYLADQGGAINYTVPGLEAQMITSAEQALELWKLQHPQFEYADKPDYNLDIAISGPVPGTNGKTAFLASGFFDKAYYFKPFVRPNHLDRRGSLRLTHKLRPNMTLRAHGGFNEFQGVAGGVVTDGEGFTNRNDFIDPRTFASAHVLFQQQLQAGIDGTLTYFQDSDTKETSIKRSTVGLGLTHALNASSFYELKFQFNHVKSSAEPGRFADLTTVTNTVDGFELNELPRGFYGLPARDFAGFYNIAGDNGRRDRSTYTTLELDVDYTNQINHFNQIKVGAGLALSHQDLNYGIDLLRNDDGLRYLRWILNDHHYQEAELYAQDKIEFKGMVMNVGLRLDYFKTDAPNFTERFSQYFTQPFNYYNPIAIEQGFETDPGHKGIYSAPSEEPDAKFALSPRLGIAHPVSENSKFFFNYGYFYQRAEVYDLSHNFQRRRNRATSLSNADLDFRKTVAYEAGFEQSIADIFDVTLSGYYRDVTNDIRGVTYEGTWQGNRIGYVRPENTGYADIRGIELSVNFRPNRYISGFFNYDYALESNGRYGYATIFQDPNRADVRVAANIDQARARPRFRTNLRLQYPNNRRASVLDKILSGAGLSTYFWWRSGVYLTYHSDNYPGFEDNNVHWTSTYNLDLEVTKPFSLSKGLNVDLYLQVQNVMNSKFLQHEVSIAWRGSSLLNPINRNVYLDLVAEQGVAPGTYEGNAAIENYLQRGLYWNQFNQPRDVWLGLRFNFN